MRAALFMSTAVGFGIIGKNEKRNETIKNTSARSLTTPPNLPRLPRRASSDSPLRRFNRTNQIEMMYEKISAALEIETMALSITSELKLMQARTSDDPRRTRRALVRI